MLIRFYSDSFSLFFPSVNALMLIALGDRKGIRPRKKSYSNNTQKFTFGGSVLTWWITPQTKTILLITKYNKMKYFCMYCNNAKARNRFNIVQSSEACALFYHLSWIYVEDLCGIGTCNGHKATMVQLTANLQIPINLLLPKRQHKIITVNI